MTTIANANKNIDTWVTRETPEPVLKPHLPIIDPHHHLWDLRTRTDSSFQQKVYFCEQIMADIDACGHNVVQTVFAQCSAFYRADGPEELRCVGETEFAHGVAAMSRSGVYGATRLCTGIFSTADLNLGAAVEPVLQAHLSASENFRGIRFPLPSRLDETFLEGYSLLAKYKLTFGNYSGDWTRLPLLAELAYKQPEVTVIVNHLGGKIDPEAGPGEFDAWRTAVDSIAASPNAVMKVGGAQQRVGPWEPPFHMHRRETPIGSEELSELLWPWYEHVIQAFGPERCMFESNFPVDKESVSYRTLWNTFKRISAKAGLSEGEETAIFSGTAARVYRLDG
jgi:predicted TIM-barrel fold metal-dependent hydrolase